MKKICIFAQFPLSALSGESSGRGGGQAATWLPQLAKSWQDQSEFELHWAVYDYKSTTSETLQKWGQYFHRIACPSMTASMLAARWPQRLAARQLFRKIKPDLIHCWGTENLNACALLDFPGPSILSMQGIITTYFKTGDLRGWRWKLFRHWEPISIRRATLVTSESQWGLDQVDLICPGKTSCRVEYGVNPSFYDVAWNPDPTRPRVLFVGTLSRIKGIDILIGMLKHYSTLPFTLSFAGAGYLHDQLKELNHPNVELLGLLKSAELQQVLSTSWALVIPSRADTSPNVVKEARVVGLPVIASPNGGQAGYVKHEQDGLLVTTNDPADWYAAMLSLTSNIERNRTYGAANHQFYRDYFRPENTSMAFTELYRQLTTG